MELTIDRVDLSSQILTFRSLKKRDKIIYRSIPVPPDYLDALDYVHQINEAQRLKPRNHGYLSVCAAVLAGVLLSRWIC